MLGERKVIRKSLIGTKVFIPKLDKYGTVISQTDDGSIEEVKIGDKIINVLEDIVEVAPTVVSILRGLLMLFGIRI